MCKFWYLHKLGMIEDNHLKIGKLSETSVKINNFPIIDDVINKYIKKVFSSKHNVLYINRFVFWLLIKPFYYKIFRNSSVEKILRLKVLTMTSSVNTWKLIFFKILIIAYHLKDNLILVIFCYHEFLWKPIEKKISGI